MLVVTPTLVIVLPHLIEVEWVEELDCAVETGGNEAYVLDVPHLGYRIRYFLLRDQRSFVLLAIVSTFFLGFLSKQFFRAANEVVSVITHVFKLVFHDRIKDDTILPCLLAMQSLTTTASVFFLGFSSSI